MRLFTKHAVSTAPMSLLKTSKRGGVCAYCHQQFQKLTKEHIVPRCYGGTVTIRVCADCNNARGDSLTDSKFVEWRRAHPQKFEEAVRQSNDPKQTQNWLQGFKRSPTKQKL